MWKYCLILLSTIAFTQSTSRWEDHFSYKNVSDLQVVEDKVYCVAENALFSYDTTSGELEKISKANRLNAIEPTSVTHNEEYDFLIIGYKSGELDFLGETDYNFIEIPLDDYQGDKTINHLYSSGDYMTISSEFGMVLFSLERMEFDETTFFRENGQYMNVNESVIFDNKVFSATDNGIYFHEIDDFISYFPAWEMPSGLPANGTSNMELFNNGIVASSGNRLYFYDGTNWSLKGTYSNIKDLKTHDGLLTVSLNNEIIVLDGNFNSVGNYTFGETLRTGIAINSNIYGGTTTNGLVAYATQEKIYPDGPYSNMSYAVIAMENQVWVSAGGQSGYNAPRGITDGYSHFNSTEWIPVPSSRLNNAQDIIHIAVNPMDTTEVFVSTWDNNHGLFKMKSNQIVEEYNNNNSPISLPYMRLGGSDVDEDGNVWVTQSFIGTRHNYVNYLYKLTPSGVWSSYDLGNYTSEKEGGVKAPVVDSRSDYIWIPETRRGGLVATNTQDYFLLSTENTGEDEGLPTNNIRSLAIDDNNIAWIGTQEGLRIKRSPISNMEGGDFSTENIVIEQNGLAEELFMDTALHDIEVDGANRKWFATEGAGAFYLSEYGAITYEHFTETNSPLPSNTIYDIAVDNETGRVYFATSKGLISYKGDATEASDSFGDVLVYPNPVRPEYNGIITIKGLANDADVRITDINGNLLERGTASGGIYQWDGTNLKGRKVASGVYLVLMTNHDGSETATAKIAIVR